MTFAERGAKCPALPPLEMICDGCSFASAQAGGPLADSMATVLIMSCVVAPSVHVCVRAAGDSQFGARAAMVLSLDA